MQSHEEAPPSYHDISSNAFPTVVTSKGDYKGVPVYEIGSNNAPIYSPTTYQQTPPMVTGHNIIPTHTIQVGRNPVHCICPQCHQQIVTNVNYDSGTFAWLMCLLLMIVGCIPCCCIPFCISSCQDATHLCPHCSAIIGSHKVL